MRLNTGVDIVDISRISYSMENPRFLTEFFSDEERDMIQKRGGSTKVIAGNFAAKEAFSKSVGTGISGFALRDVGVLRDQKGQPFFKLSGNAAEMYSDITFSVSISHTDTHVVAFVVAIFGDGAQAMGQV